MSKKLAMTIVLLAFAAGLMVIGQTSHAQQTAPAAQQGGAMSGQAMGAMSPESRLKMLTEKLSLTDDQQAKLKPILEDEAKQMKSLHDDSSLAPMDKRSKMMDAHQAFTEKINAVLTPDQQAKWKQMKQDMMANHDKMKSQGQMDHQ